MTFNVLKDAHRETVDRLKTVEAGLKLTNSMVSSADGKLELLLQRTSDIQEQGRQNFENQLSAFQTLAENQVGGKDKQQKSDDEDLDFDDEDEEILPFH